MKIRRFSVVGLNKKANFDFEFHDDINIFTGTNGSGKTTALKLAWYLISGNCVRIRQEVSFSSCRLVTDRFTVYLERLKTGDISYEFESDGDSDSALFSDPTFDVDGDPVSDGEDRLSDLIRECSPASLYFPTFRRIEGGYSIPKGRLNNPFVSLRTNSQASDNLSAQLEQLSRSISSGAHRFICSISTEDVSTLLTEKYATVSEGVNSSYTDFSRKILSQIRNWRQSGPSGYHETDEILLDIQNSANEIEALREESFRPFTVLSELVAKMFSFRGVKLRSLALGDAAKAIDSDVLSAGEKQMLSFLVYNGFYSNTPIFIDEPELSLHPDWQRKLFPTLLDQQASNQFIISTHSPFIYSKYEDKELSIGSVRGD